MVEGIFLKCLEDRLDILLKQTCFTEFHQCRVFFLREDLSPDPSYYKEENKNLRKKYEICV